MSLSKQKINQAMQGWKKVTYRSFGNAIRHFASVLRDTAEWTFDLPEFATDGLIWPSTFFRSSMQTSGYRPVSLVTWGVIPGLILQVDIQIGKK